MATDNNDSRNRHGHLVGLASRIYSQHSKPQPCLHLVLWVLSFSRIDRIILYLEHEYFLKVISSTMRPCFFYSVSFVFVFLFFDLLLAAYLEKWFDAGRHRSVNTGLRRNMIQQHDRAKFYECNPEQRALLQRPLAEINNMSRRVRQSILLLSRGRVGYWAETKFIQNFDTYEGLAMWQALKSTVEWISNVRNTDEFNPDWCDLDIFCQKEKWKCDSLMSDRVGHVSTISGYFEGNASTTLTIGGPPRKRVILVY